MSLVVSPRSSSSTFAASQSQALAAQPPVPAPAVAPTMRFETYTDIFLSAQRALSDRLFREAHIEENPNPSEIEQHAEVAEEFFGRVQLLASQLNQLPVGLKRIFESRVTEMLHQSKSLHERAVQMRNSCDSVARMFGIANRRVEKRSYSDLASASQEKAAKIQQTGQSMPSLVCARIGSMLCTTLNQLSAVYTELGQLEQQIGELQATYTRKEKLASLNASELESHWTSCREKFEQSEEALKSGQQKKESELETQIVKLRRSLDTLTADKERAETKLKEYSDQIVGLQKDILADAGVLSAFQEMLREKEQTLSAQTIPDSSALQHYRKAETEYTKAREDYFNLMKRFNGHEARIKKFDNIAISQNQQLQAIEAEIQQDPSISRLLSDLHSYESQLVSKLKEVGQEIADIEANCHRLTEEYEHDLNNISPSDSQTVPRRQTLLNTAYESERNKLRDRLTRALQQQKALNKSDDPTRLQIATLKEQISQYPGLGAQCLGAQLMEARERLQTIQQNRKELQKKQSQLGRKIARLEHFLLEKEQAFAATKNSLSSQDRIYGEIGEIKTKIDKIGFRCVQNQQALAERVRELSIPMHEAERHITRLKETIASESVQLENLLETGAAQEDVYREDLGRLQHEFSSAKYSLEQEHGTLVELFKNRQDGFNKKLEVLQQRKSVLIGTLEELEAGMTEQQRSVLGHGIELRSREDSSHLASSPASLPTGDSEQELRGAGGVVSPTPRSTSPVSPVAMPAGMLPGILLQRVQTTPRSSSEQMRDDSHSDMVTSPESNRSVVSPRSDTSSSSRVSRSSDSSEKSVVKKRSESGKGVDTQGLSRQYSTIGSAAATASTAGAAATASSDRSRTAPDPRPVPGAGELQNPSTRDAEIARLLGRVPSAAGAAVTASSGHSRTAPDPRPVPGARELQNPSTRDAEIARWLGRVPSAAVTASSGRSRTAPDPRPVPGARELQNPSTRDADIARLLGWV